MKRYKKEITERIAKNITRARAGVNENLVNQYFDELENTLAGVPPSNIFNMDETNVQDDTNCGKKKLLFARGKNAN